ncbi:hypothetical protein CC80DRAFT_451932 [Byssothecium circinans]|uniref:GCN5-related N-acetyltransferase Rv2170-like domain-containing protein n=1 Tax=Byssothecium circinans TaxID=147558 RepID=A0A6A5TKA6_9PLEO|nr:hypothetical protein CC80DRAFT_485578 [Byssothecium circinans]KAF1952818.1 hypothetical protein CC80DRAFT_451932 [Byssothecium circinans]
MKVHAHATPSPPLHHALQRALPYSINLVYRTQHPNRTPDAYILATFPPTAALDQVPECWAAAYFDRSMRPETELWIFAAFEVPTHSPTPYPDESLSSKLDICPTCKRAIHSLLAHMATLPVPPLHPSNLPAIDQAKEHEKKYPELGPNVRFPLAPGSYVRHLLLPGVVTLGAVHHKIVDVCAEAGLVRDDFPGREAKLNKFFFKVSDLPQTKELPDGLRWGEMREQDLAIVQARTSIPRTTRTLMTLKSVGVFEEKSDRAVAWTFLGLDGSLTTLHTEAEYRGKGIAKAVAAKIFREHAPELAVDGEGNAWAHADVYEGNVQSESVCRSLGGHPSVRIFWIRIDLTGADSLVSGA